LHPRAGIDPLYYYYALCNLDLSSEGYARHFKLLKEQKIHLPPLDEQRRIAKVLQSVDRTITEHVAVSSKLKDVQSASFAAFLQSGQADNSAEPVTDWTTGRVEGITKLPRGWSIVRLIDVARLESGHTPSRREPSYWENGDIDWISLHDTKNLERTEITSTELKITQDGLQNSSARLLPRGTVCFSRTATVGKCVIMGHSMATSQDFANFICSKKLNNRYLMYLFRWMQPIWKQLSSGSTHKTIYMPTFESLQIVLPSRTAQDEVVLMMDNLTAMTDQNASVLSVLQRFTTTLTSDLLSGRVRVPG
jgi:type I restriction enzyme S subunit